MFCPACLFLKILEFVSVVFRLLAAEYAGLPSQRHAVVSRTDFLPLQTTYLFSGRVKSRVRLFGSHRFARSSPVAAAVPQAAVAIADVIGAAGVLCWRHPAIYCSIARHGAHG